MRSADLLPDNYFVNSKPTDLGILTCEGGKNIPEGAVVVFPVIAHLIDVFQNPKFEAAIDITLPGQKPETTLVTVSENNFNRNITQATRVALKTACEHAGCNSGENCLLKLNVNPS